MDPIGEAIMRSQQFRGPLSHETEVRQIAGDLLTAYKQGVLDAHDLRTIADCIETGVRKGTRLKAV
ncbi:MAG TPA: hypothetical protein VGR28_05410 [Candidatus Thermoplasmatota archaeon]|nr:hypothetical protein [Candidatus Thermoplasmatota archaeon]